MMENERFGVIRDSMKNNQLLQKAEFGRIKRRCYTLPGPNFTYGQSSFVKEGGVATAIGHWDVVDEKSKVRHRKLQPNFIALNRESVKSGLVTAAEHQTFRNTHQIWCPLHEGHGPRPSLTFPPDMTFGICTRPSTPIYDLLENKYQYVWIQQQREASEALKLKSQEKIKKERVQDTRTTILRRYQPPEDPAPLWQLPRFQKVGPHLDTFPNQAARQKAFSAQHSDGIAHRGLRGQGVYNIS
ncbi:cilia- and flagella-associated protein 77 [Spea bombifrons]|uniref:cilia- and flagella-associated protein 77 n=1 Tax=Spea bombifrons TaxID=233779 RepID=UPI002349BCEB|nr:cilia- and flagella-associated protein 77 [Spea bombifrons]